MFHLPQIHYVAEDALNLLILLRPPPRYEDYKWVVAITTLRSMQYLELDPGLHAH